MKITINQRARFVEVFQSLPNWLKYRIAVTDMDSKSLTARLRKQLLRVCKEKQ